MAIDKVVKADFKAAMVMAEHEQAQEQCSL